MRHYIRRTEIGELVGCDTRTRGWPDGADPNDQDTKDAAAARLRALRARIGGFVAWVAYDCPCPRDLQSCMCAYGMVDDHYYNGVVLFPKPELTLEVNESAVSTDTVDLAPGSSAQLRLVGAVPNGHTVDVFLHDAREGSGPRLLTTVKFNGGTSDTTQIKAPQQGMSLLIHGSSKYVRRFTLTVRGWA